MIRQFLQQPGSLLRLRFLQFFQFRASFLIGLLCIHALQCRFGSIALGKQVITKSTLPFCLQSRAIRAESHQVVFPGHIIHTFGIAFAASLYIERFRNTGLYGVSGRTIGSYRSGKYNFAVIGNLIRELLPVDIQNHNLCRICQSQPVCNSFHRYLYHLIRALQSQRVGYRNGYRLTFVTSEAKQSRHT